MARIWSLNWAKAGERKVKVVRQQNTHMEIEVKVEAKSAFGGEVRVPTR